VFFLKQSIEDQLANEGPPQEPSSPRANRLPPISPKSQSSGGNKKEKKPITHMVLGAGISVSGPSRTVNSSPPQPVSSDDFFRLADGIYSFRVERVIEMWVERGEPMLRDHGPHSNLAEIEASVLEDPDARDDPVKDQELRRLLGLGKAPPIGRGVSLPSFLVKQ